MTHLNYDHKQIEAREFSGWDDGQPSRLLFEDYSVGWICAVPISAGGLPRHARLHSPAVVKKLEDANPYEFGNIGYHNTVLACLNSYGMSHASHIAANMTASLPSTSF
jgi:hypothetical protein